MKFSTLVLVTVMVVAQLSLPREARAAQPADSVVPDTATVDTTRVIEIDPVIVTVTHLQTLRSRVPNSVSVVSRAQIEEAGASSVLAVVSDRVPGLFVTQRGVLGYGVAGGSAGKISIRGVGADPVTQVAVMTDGRPQTMGLMGHPIADMHVSGGVERVEVVRGPSSVLYGTAAMGGVVNVVTRRDWEPGVGVETAAAYGTHGTQRLEASLDYGSDSRNGLIFTGSRYRTDGHRSNSSFAIDNFSVRGSTDLGTGYSLVGDVALSDMLAYDPGPVAAPRTDNWVDILRGSAGVSLENSGAALSGATKLFLNFGRHKIHDGFFSRDYTAGAQLHQGITLDGGGTVTLGADLRRFGGKARRDSDQRPADWGEHHVHEIGAFGLLHQPLLPEVVLTGGARANYHSTYGVELAPQLGVAYRIRPQTTLRASSSRGFRSPTIRELYLFPAPTPDLKPERAWNNEVSLLNRLGERASLELAAYRTEGTDLIRVTGAPPNLELANSGEFLHRGIELVLAARPLDDLELDLSYGYMDVGELTQRHPRNQVHMSGRYRIGQLMSSLSVQHVTGVYGSDGGRDRLPDYTVVDGRVSMDVREAGRLFLSLDNLLDTDYEIMSGYPMPGRMLSAGLQFRSR